MFNNTMVQIETTIPVLGMFPFASLKDQVEAEPDRPFIVDIGGGKGQALKQVQQEVPNGFGAKMILQDRPDVLESVPDKEIPGIEKMEHDFFTEQPVKSMYPSQILVTFRLRNQTTNHISHLLPYRCTHLPPSPHPPRFPTTQLPRYPAPNYPRHVFLFPHPDSGLHHPNTHGTLLRPFPLLHGFLHDDVEWKGEDGGGVPGDAGRGRVGDTESLEGRAGAGSSGGCVEEGVVWKGTGERRKENEVGGMEHLLATKDNLVVGFSAHKAGSEQIALLFLFLFHFHYLLTCK